MLNISLQKIANTILLANKRNCFCMLFICILFVSFQVNAQNNSSPIWGNSSSVTIGQPLYNQQTWGVAPSQQTLNTIPNRNGMDRSNNNQSRRLRNSDGNLLLTDAQGNIVRDNSGNPIIDSSSMGQQSGSINEDEDGSPPPPPDDPVDAPIDGGVGILMMIGLGIGYQNRNKKNIRLAPIFL